MSQVKARLAPAGRLTLVERVLSGRPVSHVAKEMGVSRQCAHRWVSRFRHLGAAGALDRSSRHHSHPATTSPATAANLLELRRTERLGRNELARRIGVRASTASRIIARAGQPALHQLDPVTGIRIRASRRKSHRYEREEPGDLIHFDVKKLGCIPHGGGWHLDGPTELDHRGVRRQRRMGFDYVHGAFDHHSRLAFVRALPNEKGPTCAAFLTEAASVFAGNSFTIREVMTDNAWNYTHSREFKAVLRPLDANHVLTQPHSPGQNGKTERFNRTLHHERWAYRRPFTSNQDHIHALEPWLDHYNCARPHTACEGQPPISPALHERSEPGTASASRRPY